MQLLEGLVSCRSRENCRHQLRCSLTSARGLGSKPAVNSWRKRNAGDDEIPWRQSTGSELLLENRVELPHALPFLGGCQILEIGNHGTVGADQNVCEIVIRDVGMLDLQAVDNIFYLVGKFVGVRGTYQFERVRKKIGDRAPAHLRAVEPGSVTTNWQQAQKAAQQNQRNVL